VDFIGNVTVFVPTCGDRPSLPHCLDALSDQDVQFGLSVIMNVAPMSAAFNAMIERCKTPLFIQCDDDMLLRRYAVRRLVESMEAADHDVAIYAHPLWDVHVNRPIFGVKIYRADAIRDVGGWSDVQSCEVDQLSRLDAAGYKLRTAWDSAWSSPDGFRYDHPMIMGDHDPMFTPSLAYERYKDLIMKHRKLQNAAWVEQLPGLFLARVRGERACVAPLDVEVAALAGCIAGLTATLPDSAGEKDFLARPWDAEWAACERLLKVTCNHV